jgi:hypothetical protein
MPFAGALSFDYFLQLSAGMLQVLVAARGD